MTRKKKNFVLDFPFFNGLPHPPLPNPLNGQNPLVTKSFFVDAPLRDGSGEIPTFL